MEVGLARRIVLFGHGVMKVKIQGTVTARAGRRKSGRGPLLKHSGCVIFRLQSENSRFISRYSRYWLPLKKFSVVLERQPSNPCWFLGPFCNTSLCHTCNGFAPHSSLFGREYNRFRRVFVVKSQRTSSDALILPF